MTLQEIENKLVEAVASIKSKDKSSISVDTPLYDLGIDSLGLVEIFVFIEKNFNLKLLESGLTKEDLYTVHTLASYLIKRI